MNWKMQVETAASLLRGRAAMLILAVWLGGTYFLSFQVSAPRVRTSLDFEMQLPEKLGDWNGRGILYCSKMSCGKSIMISGGQAPSECPRCGSALVRKSPSEARILPEEVEIERKFYTRPGGRGLLVTLVAGGAFRESIHKPQRCLTAQGSTILNSRVISVPLEGRKEPLKMMVLETDRAGSGRRLSGGFFAYWFVGQGRETPYNLERMFWIAWDRLFEHRVSRWAYISITGRRDAGGSSEYVTDLHKIAERVVRAVYK
jgi:predicted RNA-binding Zn-ribbon protein involved in translation (DUF1610 family)